MKQNRPLLRFSKLSSCLLNPIPARLLKDILPMIAALILNMISASLLMGFEVPFAFQVTVIKLLLEKPSLTNHNTNKGNKFSSYGL